MPEQGRFTLFCSNCGKTVGGGGKFCTECGEPLPAASPPASPAAPAPGSQQAPPSPPPAAVQPAPPAPPTPAAPPSAIGPPPKGTPAGGKGGGTGFFRTPAGIAVIVVVVLLVAGGAVTGIILAVRGGSGSAFEDEIARAWEEYEDIVDEADGGTGIDITSAVMLARYEKELEQTRRKVEALEKVLERLNPPDDYWKEKYEQLSGTLGYYDRYVRKLNDLYVTLATGDLDTRLNTVDAILKDLERLADQVRNLAKEFLENNRAVTAGDFSPDILDLPGAIATEVEKVATGQTTDGQETGQSDESAVADARAVLEEVLALYRGGGWQAITAYMSPELLQAFNSAPVSWDQVSYTVTGTDIQSETMNDPDTVVFNVLETRDDFGEIFTESVDWQMVNSGSGWKVNNTINEFGESKL